MQGHRCNKQGQKLSFILYWCLNVEQSCTRHQARAHGTQLKASQLDKTCTSTHEHQHVGVLLDIGNRSSKSSLKESRSLHRHSTYRMVRSTSSASSCIGFHWKANRRGQETAHHMIRSCIPETNASLTEIPNYGLTVQATVRGELAATYVWWRWEDSKY